MDMYDLPPLPFFPIPYPGESLYSVLCRYHVRSGNVSSHRTIRQLFGRYASLVSTLLLPPTLYLFDFWAQNTGITAENILRNHTAFSLCKVSSFHEYQHIFSSTNRSSVFSRNLLRGSFQQASIQHPSHKLRYCRQCAEEQKKFFGESYWQIVPQLDGVEYCPIHKIRILSSNIHVSQIQHAFFPADSIMTNADPVQVNNVSTWYNESFPAIFPEVFLSMSKAIAYLWKNINHYSGIWFLLSRYREFLSVENTLWLETESVRTKLLENNPHSLVNQFLNAKDDVVDRRFVYYSRLSMSEHAMLISMLAPTPEAFFAT